MVREILNLPIKRISVGGGTQARVEINQSVVSEYTEFIRLGGDLPAIIVFQDGVNIWLGDGFHRFHAYRGAGAVEIPCEIRDGTQRDAILYSVGANASHGLRRTNEDKRKAVMTLLSDAEWSTWSDDEVAKTCGVGRAFVNTVRKESILSQSDKIDSSSLPVIRTVTRNGKTYQMNVASIGESNPSKVVPLNEDALAAIRKIPLIDTKRSSVYVLAGGGRIKVGFSISPQSRITELLRHQADGELLAIAHGSQSQEKAVHSALKGDRDSGEWFISKLDDVLSAMRSAGLEPIVVASIGMSPNHGEPAAPIKERCADSRITSGQAAPTAIIKESCTQACITSDQAAPAVAAISDELASLREENDDLRAQLKQTLAENEMMGRVYDADDRLKAAMDEAKRQKAIAENAERTLAAKNGEYIERARAVKMWQNRANKAEKALALLNKAAA